MSEGTPAETSSADSPYGVGVGGNWKHAVDCGQAVLVPARRSELLAFALCGEPAVPVPSWGGFDRANPLFAAGRAAERCPHCVWRLALEQRAEAAEIAMLTPVGRDLDVLARLLPDPMMVPRICEAILDRSGLDYDRDHPHVAQLLGHVTAHAPRILAPEECWEGDCDHDRAAGTAFCSRPDVSAACSACSILAGPWAGESEGRFAFECTVAAPCDVLRTLARHYGIGPDGPAEASSGTARPVVSGERA